MKRSLKPLFRKCEDWAEFEYDPNGTRKNRHRHKVHMSKKGRIRAIIKRDANKEIDEI